VEVELFEEGTSQEVAQPTESAHVGSPGIVSQNPADLDLQLGEVSQSLAAFVVGRW